MELDSIEDEYICRKMRIKSLRWKNPKRVNDVIQSESKGYRLKVRQNARARQKTQSNYEEISTGPANRLY